MINGLRHWKAKFRYELLTGKVGHSGPLLYLSPRQIQIHLGRSKKIFAFSLASTFCVSFIALTLCVHAVFSRCTPSFICWEVGELQQCCNWLMCLCSWDAAVQAHGRDILSMEVFYCYGNRHRDRLQDLANTWQTWSSLPFAPSSLLAILQMLRVYSTSFLILEFPLTCATI